MANEADPVNMLAVKTSVFGRLIGLSHVGLGGDLEILKRNKTLSKKTRTRLWNEQHIAWLG